ncbi:MAG: tetratricopeptide repeat protein [Pseudomonadota bacterium]
MATTPEMRQFVDDVVPRGGSEDSRIDALIYALRHPGIKRIEYDAGANYNAAEVFRTRRANCLSFAALFISLAREAGFRARFQSVEAGAQWERLDNDLLLRLQHVNTLVSGAGNKEHIIEFQRDRFNLMMTRKPVTDAFGIGLYYNNVGGDYLFRGELDTARAYLSHALTSDPRLAAAWVNLGVTHRRQGRPDLAEISYRQALEVDRRSTVAMNNLATLLERRGESEIATVLRDRAFKARLKNPNYHFALARHAYDEQNYQAALGHLDEALRRDGRAHNFHHLMALTLHALGEAEEARASLRRAARKATNDQDRDSYRATLAAWDASPHGT